MWLRSKQSSRCCGNWPSYNAELRHHLSWEKWGIVPQMCMALLIHNILQNVMMSRCATTREEGYKLEVRFRRDLVYCDIYLRMDQDRVPVQKD
jgi:hypothetical protein